MKLLSAIFFAILAVGPLSAQYWSTGGFGSIAFPGLGHAPAGGNPWGNVVSPALPQGASAFAAAQNRYGSLIPGFGGNNGAARGSRRARPSSIYAFPAYVGGYGYGYGNGSDQAAPPPSDAGPANPPAPAVVINQYFGQPPADQGPPPVAGSDSNFHFYQSPVNSTDAPPSDSSYYLIAFKDHTVYSAVAYYTEGDTLHYFTAGNVHNQVSLSLVDRQLTEQLNHQRNVEVHLPQ